jgi:hypothetical protein
MPGAADAAGPGTTSFAMIVRSVRDFPVLPRYGR